MCATGFEMKDLEMRRVCEKQMVALQGLSQYFLFHVVKNHIDYDTWRNQVVDKSQA